MNEMSGAVVLERPGARVRAALLAADRRQVPYRHWLLTRVLPESRDPLAEHRPDVIGAALVALGVGAIALGLVEAPDWGWGSPKVIGLLVLAICTLLEIVVRVFVAGCGFGDG